MTFAAVNRMTTDVRREVTDPQATAAGTQAKPDLLSAAQRERPGGFRKFVWQHSLTLTLLGLFLLTLVGQIWSGLREYNTEQREHGQPTESLGAYLLSGHFVEATMENWESEFLQMGAFVILTVFLRQKGSPESKPMEGEEEVDREPDPSRSGAPWPVRKGGFVLWLYSNSLSIAFFLLFAISFLLHAAGGAHDYSQQQLTHGQPTVSIAQYMVTSRFWFESFQNWQSEFLSIAAMVYLAVYLRQKGSPESKPVDASHEERE
jgi:hypothetical protein